jgi:hypothetical protein
VGLIRTTQQFEDLHLTGKEGVTFFQDRYAGLIDDIGRATVCETISPTVRLVLTA